MATSCTDTCQRDVSYLHVRGLQETKLEKLVSRLTSANLGTCNLRLDYENDFGDQCYAVGDRTATCERLMEKTHRIIAKSVNGHTVHLGKAKF